MNNAWLNPYNNVKLTGVIDVTTNARKCISFDKDGQEQIYNI
jgi:hypothetical protein